MSQSPSIPNDDDDDEEDVTDGTEDEIVPDEDLTNSVKEFEEESEPVEDEEEELEENLAELDDETANLFDGVEEDTIDDSSEGEEMPTANDTDSEAMGQAISNGFATIMTVGLDDDDRKEYRPQFKEVFNEFQVDYYAGEVITEKLLEGDDEIDPTYALVGATALACITCFTMRPDSDEKLSSMKEKLQGE